MKKFSWIFGMLFGVCCFWGSITAQAEKNHFSVQAELPTNQINHDAGYFDLMMKPGQQQTVYVRIYNGDEKDHVYDVITNIAMTSNSGSISYSEVEPILDKSVAFNVAEATNNHKGVVVKANTTKRVGITIEMPKKSFEGIALGGINILQQVKQEKNKSSSGFSLQNQFGYVLGLKLQEQKKNTVKPDMKLLSAGPRQINGYNHIVAQLQNPRATIMENLKVSSYVTKNGDSKKLLKTTKEKMRMAPNSNFYYALGDGQKQLKPGKYTLYLNADSEKGKYKWNFKKEFTITAQKARKLNKTSVIQPEKVTNWWLVGGLAVVILALLGWIIWLLRTRRKED